MPFDGQILDVISDYFCHITDQVVPYYSEAGIHGNFTGVGGRQIQYVKFVSPENHKAILISPGRAEPAMKYSELIHDIKGHGFDIYVIDHRGQGFSERLLDDPQKGHVENFKDYWDDFQAFADVVSSEKRYMRRVLLAHCMGAVIGLGFAQRCPDFFDAAIVSNPMMRIRLKGLAEWFGMAAFKGMCLLGKDKDYILGGGPEESCVPFEKSDVTTCPLRYNMARFLEKQHTEFVSGSPTNRWVYEAIKGSLGVYSRRKKIDFPVLHFLSGKDAYVGRSRQERFFKRFNHYKRLYFKNARHEIFQERDEIRSEVIKEIISFLQVV